MLGHLLAGDTSQQKMFLLVGPKRGGKGTIGRVWPGLLGAHQVGAPTLASLSTNFGLQPLIGKPLALISDARLSTKADSKIVGRTPVVNLWRRQSDHRSQIQRTVDWSPADALPHHDQ